MKIGEKLNKKGMKLMKPLRASITRESSGPDISTIIEIFGKKKTKDRIKEFLEYEQ